jgi:flagellar basal body-associated protein FliL
MNNILNKFGSSDPETILNLINPDDPDYLTIAIKYKKYNRLLKDDLLEYVNNIKLRNRNIHNTYIKILNRNNAEIDSIMKYIDSIGKD